MRGRIIGWTLSLLALAGAGLGGWFVGSDLVAPQPEGAPVAVDRETGEEIDLQALAQGQQQQQEAQTDTADGQADPQAEPTDPDDATIVAGRVTIAVNESADPNRGLVLGASGLSPFGHPDGLRGRQVLAGRVTSVSAGKLLLDTATGPATIRIVDSSTFLVRLRSGDASEIQAGAAVALILNDDGDAVAAIVLPADSRPVLDPLGPGFPDS